MEPTSEVEELASIIAFVVAFVEVASQVALMLRIYNWLELILDIQAEAAFLEEEAFLVEALLEEEDYWGPYSFGRVRKALFQHHPSIWQELQLLMLQDFLLPKRPRLHLQLLWFFGLRLHLNS